MKNLIQITTVLFLLAQTIGFSQTTKTDATSSKQDTILKKEVTKTESDTLQLKSFIGKYLLEEADFTLEIIEENNKMYIVSPFSKDLLILKNETTLHEPTRGVDLELIKDDKDALKFTQTGYVKTIKRVKSEETQN
jgi:hypothetical protein